jgi:hypothetical protein
VLQLGLPHQQQQQQLPSLSPAKLSLCVLCCCDGTLIVFVCFSSVLFIDVAF